MSEVKNVLSIDVDYVMAPCIQLYNHYVGTILDCLKEEFGPEPEPFYGSHLKEFWQWLNEDLFCDRYYIFDQTKFEEVSDLLADKASCLSDSRIYFGKEHDSILTFLCGNMENANVKFNVYNVDHHHDIYYQDTARAEIERFAYANITDWVWYLYDFGLINNYYWISNIESMEPSLLEDSCDLFKTLHSIKSVSELKDIKFDYIFVCKSEYYVPPKYHFLFDTLKERVESIKNTKFLIDNNSYCNGRTRFPAWW